MLNGLPDIAKRKKDIEYILGLAKSTNTIFFVGVNSAYKNLYGRNFQDDFKVSTTVLNQQKGNLATTFQLQSYNTWLAALK